jgi:phosphoglycerate dehydrogenase-like enzyme
MMKVVVLDDYQDVALRCADWSSLPAEVETLNRHIDDMDELADALGKADVVVAMRERTPFPASLLERLPNLRLLVTTAMYNASIDVEAAAARGILVCGTRGVKVSTAELTLGLVLALLRHIPGEQQSLRAGGWQQRLGMGLEGKTIGLLGLGTVGGHVARMAQAFGMQVVSWSTNLTRARAEECGARLVSKEDLLRRSDIVSVHLVLGERNRHLLTAADFALMRPESYLVNTSRAGIVDTQALVDALRAGAIAGAAVDVYDEEPLPGQHPLREAPNTVLTPHIGYVTEEDYRLFYGDAVADIAAWLDGTPIRVLNAPR